MAKPFAEEYALPVDREKSFAEKHGLDLSPYIDKPAPPEWLAGAAAQAKADERAGMLAGPPVFVAPAGSTTPASAPAGAGGPAAPAASVEPPKASEGPPPPVDAPMSYAERADEASGVTADQLAPPGSQQEWVNDELRRRYEAAKNAPGTPGGMRPAGVTTETSVLNPDAAKGIDAALAARGRLSALEAFRDSERSAAEVKAQDALTENMRQGEHDYIEKLSRAREEAAKKAVALETLANDDRSPFEKMFGANDFTRALGVIGAMVSGVMSIRSGYDVMNGWLRRKGAEDEQAFSHKKDAYEVFRQKGMDDVAASAAVTEKRAQTITQELQDAYSRIGAIQVGDVATPGGYVVDADGKMVRNPQAFGNRPPTEGDRVMDTLSRVYSDQAQTRMWPAMAAAAAKDDNPNGPFATAARSLPRFASLLVPDWAALSLPQIQVLKEAAVRDVQVEEQKQAAAGPPPPGVSPLRLDAAINLAKATVAGLEQAEEAKLKAADHYATKVSETQKYVPGTGGGGGDKYLFELSQNARHQEGLAQSTRGGLLSGAGLGGGGGRASVSREERLAKDEQDKRIHAFNQKAKGAPEVLEATGRARAALERLSDAQVAAAMTMPRAAIEAAAMSGSADARAMAQAAQDLQAVFNPERHALFAGNLTAAEKPEWTKQSGSFDKGSMLHGLGIVEERNKTLMREAATELRAGDYDAVLARQRANAERAQSYAQRPGNAPPPPPGTTQPISNPTTPGGSKFPAR